MKRIPFLKKAIRIAKKQIDDESCLPDDEWTEILNDIQNEEMNEDEALREKAEKILECAYQSFRC